MANPVCLSPLKFYDKIAKQSHRKSYAYGNISPLITKLNRIPPFQFVIPKQLYIDGGNTSIFTLYDAKTDEPIQDAISQDYVQAEDNFKIIDVEEYKVFMHLGYGVINAINIPTEGFYYLKLASGNSEVWAYYSEVFCFTDKTDDCIEIEYWNETGDFAIKNGIITFTNNFHFHILLRTEIGKPEYSFEEEGTKRLGYNFIESQVSKKTYKFNAVEPEYVCDALRLIRLCDNKIIRCKDNEYEALSFNMEVEWQTQGDLASVNCEFETDNVIVNIGGFVPDSIGGDFNNDFNNDFNKERSEL